MSHSLPQQDSVSMSNIVIKGFDTPKDSNNSKTECSTVIANDNEAENGNTSRMEEKTNIPKTSLESEEYGFRETGVIMALAQYLERYEAENHKLRAEVSRLNRENGLLKDALDNTKKRVAILEEEKKHLEFMTKMSKDESYETQQVAHYEMTEYIVDLTDGPMADLRKGRSTLRSDLEKALMPKPSDSTPNCTGGPSAKHISVKAKLETTGTQPKPTIATPLPKFFHNKSRMNPDKVLMPSDSAPIHKGDASTESISKGFLDGPTLPILRENTMSLDNVENRKNDQEDIQNDVLASVQNRDDTTTIENAESPLVVNEYSDRAKTPDKNKGTEDVILSVKRNGQMKNTEGDKISKNQGCRKSTQNVLQRFLRCFFKYGIVVFILAQAAGIQKTNSIRIDLSVDCHSSRNELDQTTYLRLCDLKEGDHIYFWRPYLIKHHLLVLDVDPVNKTLHVVHYKSNPFMTILLSGFTSKSVVTKDTINVMEERGWLYKVHYEVEPCLYNVRKRVDEVLGESAYSLMYNNCENLIVYIKTGIRYSYQSDFLFRLALYVCFIYLIITLFDLRKTKLENEQLKMEKNMECNW